MSDVTATTGAAGRGEADTRAEAAAEPALNPREAAVERHFDRISNLLSLAEAVAEAMLGQLTRRVMQGKPAYPGELIQLCRGLHVLAKVGLELRKHLRLLGRPDNGRRGITSADIDKLAAKLQPLFAKAA
jgi:hypothetical protein